jgi:hypothetical protein
VDLVVASEAVAGLLASGAAKQLGEDAGGGLAAGIVARVRKVFGSDARSVDALERVGRDDLEAIGDLAAALAWYARRDQEFATALIQWAGHGRTGDVEQRVRAERNAYVAGRDQTVVNSHWQLGE